MRVCAFFGESALFTFVHKHTTSQKTRQRSCGAGGSWGVVLLEKGDRQSLTLSRIYSRHTHDQIRPCHDLYYVTQLNSQHRSQHPYTEHSHTRQLETHWLIGHSTNALLYTLSHTHHCHISFHVSTVPFHDLFARIRFARAHARCYPCC